MNNSIEGVCLPGPPRHPHTRVVTKPKPFQRPSTTIMTSGVTREWRTVPAGSLGIGDTVPDIGIIRQYRITAGTMIVLGGIGNTTSWPADEPVYAFTAAA